MIILKDGKRSIYVFSTGGGWGKAGITKDCGLLPFILHKNHNFNAYMVSYNIQYEVIEYANLYTPGLQFADLESGDIPGQIKFIAQNAEDIDLMILYGAYMQFLPMTEIYKKLRPDGKIYLSSDMNIAWADRTPSDSTQYKRFLDNCDVIAASCRATQKYLSTKWHVPVNLIRNPFYNFANVTFENLFERKENIILTVGRLGTDQKQNHIMMEGFAKVADKLPDWKMRLVGSIQESFKPYMKNYFERFPQLTDRVIFVGEIYDRAKLMEEYKRAKIFILTSNMEGGTPNVTGEALWCGDFIITSNFDSKDDMTDYGKCGKDFPIGDIDALSKLFLEVCNDENLLLQGGRHAYEYAREQFDANHVVARLNYLLYGGE